MLYGFSESILIQNNFVKCYDEPYSDATTTDDLIPCSGNSVFVGAKSTVNAPTFEIGAFGKSTNVFSITSAQNIAYYDSAGGAYWYRLPSNSFGFAGTSTVNLNSCDFGQDNTDCISRLCWHLDQANLGGFRAGCVTGLTFNSNWRKVMYATNATYQCGPGMKYKNEAYRLS